MDHVEPGTIIGGRYRITDEIGRGGLTTVYRAVDLRLNRVLALKVLHSPFANDPSFVARIEREARIQSSLHHPGILRVYDFGREGDHVFLALEHIEGTSLADELHQRGKLPPEQAMEIIRQVGEALRYAHSHGVIHRDIKPSNILIAKDGRVVLSDFGIAAATGELSLTQIGTVLGTPEYMSPEQALGERVDQRSDIYSLGVVLYQMLTGKLPFKGETVTEMLRTRVETPPRPPRIFNPDISPKLEGITLKALAKQPFERYQSVDAFLSDLQTVCDDVQEVAAAGASPVLGSPAASPFPKSPAASPVQRSPLSERALARKPFSRVWLMLISIAVLAIGLVLVGQLVLLGLMYIGAKPGRYYVLLGLLLLAVVLVSVSLQARRLLQRRVKETPEVASTLSGLHEAQPSTFTTPITEETIPLRRGEVGTTAILRRTPKEAMASLLVLNGPQRGQHLMIRRGITIIGRSPELSEVCLRDNTVSRRHAEIRLEGGMFWIYDLGSANGTYVNGSRVERQVLHDRDEIRVGDTNLIFMQISTGEVSPEVRQRLREFDAVWEELTRAARYE